MELATTIHVKLRFGKAATPEFRIHDWFSSNQASNMDCHLRMCSGRPQYAIPVGLLSRTRAAPFCRTGSRGTCIRRALLPRPGERFCRVSASGNGGIRLEFTVVRPNAHRYEAAFQCEHENRGGFRIAIAFLSHAARA